ncbi:jg27598, partial [Pararge aegeria aegeria]
DKMSELSDVRQRVANLRINSYQIQDIVRRQLQIKLKLRKSRLSE